MAPIIIVIGRLRIEIKTTTVPNLKICADLVAASEDQGVMETFVNLYTSMLRYLLNEPTSGPISLRTLKKDAEKEWNKKLPDMLSSMHLPPFVEIWNEIRRMLPWSRIDLEDLEGRVGFANIRIHRAQAIALAIICQVNASFSPRIEAWFAAQPIYHDLPSDIDAQLAERRRPGGLQWMALAQALRPNLTNTRGLIEISGTFTMFVTVMVRLFQITNFAPTTTQITILAESLIHHSSMEISSPLHDQGILSLSVRQAMSTCNVRGVFDLLVKDIKDLLETVPRVYLGWYLHRKLANTVLCLDIDPEGVSELRTKVFQTLEWGYVFGTAAIPIELYVPSRVLHLVPQVDSIFRGRSWEEYNPEDLKDVEFEAVGPPLNVLAYSQPSSEKSRKDICGICMEEFSLFPQVKLLNCSHSYHRSCLQVLINGIEKHSSRCPECRTQICPPRQKRRKVDQPAR
ncbi:hypothetical protein BDV96DRAFT_595962 [Lophiotrema nucula]|uniref:RING-type domain-containing protein n=1 Tax=Lophiotrema nucula TaxID=690887 RepID=A0A6A5ZI82_9PLEO|nr:hypothetical protein BDV96DRAFT_595962 [Lophiotrema nucula]